MRITGIVACASLATMVLVASNAAAQLPSAAQKCIDGYNNKTRLVSQQAGKSARACIKNAGKGVEPDPETCIVSNVDGKIAGKETKVCDLYPDKCTGAEPIQQGCATGNASHRGAIEDLVHDIFGDPVTNSSVISPGSITAKCQDKTIQRAAQYFTENMKGFRKCKKGGMKTGFINNEFELEFTCVVDVPSYGLQVTGNTDPNQKVIDKGNKLFQDVVTNCATVNIASAFAGECSSSGSANALGVCIFTRARCRVCLALNQADGMAIDCDEFDDLNASNSSCNP